MKIRHLFASRRSSSARGGFTIIEVIVAMTGLVLVGGIILQIYDETQAAAQKMVRRQSAIDYAVSFVDQSSELLRNAVRPGNLDVDIQPAFTADRLAVPAFGDPASNGLFLVTLRPSEAEDADHPYEIVRRSILGDGSGEENETVNAFGNAFDSGEPKVSFRYATEAKPGVPVAYVDRLGAGEWPVLVEIAIEVPTGNESDAPIAMRTAVIPGRLPGRAAAVATPTPTPIPASSLRDAVAGNAAAAVEDAATTAAEAAAETLSSETGTTEAAP